MLEPRFTPAEVKAARSKRSAFLKKLDLLVSLIGMLEAPVKDFVEEDLDKKMAQLNKLENDEYLATLKGMANL